ncbi:hypothetical protein DL98DRAFT_540859 [Cadophora sp. DSE1049]|nr:hypothetical protein DL98DRAFT_540859 [Cadophora sp. DSE1049]
MAPSRLSPEPSPTILTPTSLSFPTAQNTSGAVDGTPNFHGYDHSTRPSPPPVHVTPRRSKRIQPPVSSETCNTGAEGCKQSNNQELCKTSGHIEETICEDYTGGGKGKMNNYIPNGTFYI